MNQPTGYPKTFWVLTRAEVIVEDGREVVNHTSESIIGGTFDLNVAERMAAVLKQHEGLQTMIKSDVNPTPLALLDAIAPQEENPEVQKLLDMVDM